MTNEELLEQLKEISSLMSSDEVIIQNDNNVELKNLAADIKCRTYFRYRQWTRCELLSALHAVVSRPSHTSPFGKIFYRLSKHAVLSEQILHILQP